MRRVGLSRTTIAITCAGILAACSATAPPAEPPGAPTPEPQEALPPEPWGPPAWETAAVDTAVEEAFVAGLVSAKLGEFEAARREIGWVAAMCPDSPAGHRALLALAGIELDPRNPDGDPAAARLAVERYLASPTKPAWTEPTAKALYLIAVELGGRGPGESRDEGRPAEGADGSAASVPAPEVGRPGPAAALGGDRGSECDASAVAAPVGSQPPPVLPGEPLAERLARAERERGELREKATSLERELAELRQELERIRRALRP